MADRNEVVPHSHIQQGVSVTPAAIQGRSLRNGKSWWCLKQVISGLELLNQHQGHLASLHLKQWTVSLVSLDDKLEELSSTCKCFCESTTNPWQHFSLLSRTKASSLYAGLLYLGCWMNWTFFHQSLTAYNMVARTKENS